jgi:hypothetical protein
MCFSTEYSATFLHTSVAQDMTVSKKEHAALHEFRVAPRIKILFVLDRKIILSRAFCFGGKENGFKRRKF